MNIILYIKIIEFGIVVYFWIVMLLIILVKCQIMLISLCMGNNFVKKGDYNVDKKIKMYNSNKKVVCYYFIIGIFYFIFIIFLVVCCG